MCSQAGGGGAGGFREVKSPSATPYTASPLMVIQAHQEIELQLQHTAFAIAVGGGGTGAPGSGNNGSLVLQLFQQ